MSRMKPVNDLQAVAKMFRHSPKKVDFHVKMHLNTFLTPISLSMSLLVTLNGIIKSITTSIRERGLTCIDYENVRNDPKYSTSSLFATACSSPCVSQ